MSILATSFLAARVFDTPLMITWEKAQIIIGVLSPHFGLEQEALLKSNFPPPAQQNNSLIPDEIRVIEIYGTLVHRTAALLSAESGLLSYDAIRDQFANAIDDSSVSSILLDIDSFGGEVAGVFDLVDDIYQARGIKPIYAIANENAYSAAYALASAADKIYLPRTGGVGSIGVIAVHIDQSGFNSKVGVVYTPIFAGARKNDFTPHASLSDEALGVAQREIDQTYNIFVETIARNRGLSAAVVRATQAAIYQGQNAVAQGLADGIASYEQVVELLTKLNQNQNGGKPMFGKKTTVVAEPIIAQAEDQQLESVAQLNAATGEGYKRGFADGIRQEGARCVQIQEQVAAISHLLSDEAVNLLLNNLLKSTVTPELAGKQIISALAANQYTPEIRSTVSATSTGEINPLVANARKRAQAAQQQGGVN